MLARKRPDISWRDLAFGIAKSVAPQQLTKPYAEIPSQWFPANESIESFSVRSGLDLLLQALNLPRGSEVIVTSITIPDMLQIIEYHGLIAVPVSMEANQLEPRGEDIERAITSKTRAILVAHLFGSRMEMQPIISILKRIGAVVIEDCAQAFVGYDYAGHEKTDAALFSFGPIKTATALGGAILRIRNKSLRNKIRQLQNTYPTQSKLSYAVRLLKYAYLKVASIPLIYRIFVCLLRTLGIDYDSFVSQMGRSFDHQNFFPAIRKNPCETLKQMMLRRIIRFDQDDKIRLQRRTRIGKFLIRSLAKYSLRFPGNKNCSHTFWAVAVQVKRSDSLIHSLRNAGFDATTRSSLCDVKTQDNSLRSWLDETIFLPTDPAMSAQSLRRMCRLLKSS